MSARILTLSAALLLGACSTVQENPNYQFSSKYGEPATAPTVQLADQTSAEPTYARATIEPVTGHQTTTVANHSGTQTTSPTEQAYNADAMAGTPGYAILLAEEAQARSSASQPSTSVPPNGPSSAVQSELIEGPQPIAYDYAQNIIVTDTPEVANNAVAKVSTPTSAPYIVQPGDTVYSLARHLCAPISDIMTANGITSDFAIDIGQTLELPASRC